MKLLTKEIEKAFERTGRQEEVPDPIVVAKFFYPFGPATWFATEYEPATRTFFGWCSLGLGSDEWGYFSLDELEQTVVYGVHIERDLHFEAKPISKVAPAALAALGRE